jgi:hypothetical protein
MEASMREWICCTVLATALAASPGAAPDASQSGQVAGSRVIGRTTSSVINDRARLVIHAGTSAALVL